MTPMTPVSVTRCTMLSQRSGRAPGSAGIGSRCTLSGQGYVQPLKRGCSISRRIQTDSGDALVVDVADARAQRIIGRNDATHVSNPAPVLRCREFLVPGEQTGCGEDGSPVFRRGGVVELEQLQAQGTAIRLILNRLVFLVGL